MSINRIDPSDLYPNKNRKHRQALRRKITLSQSARSLESITEEQTVVQKADKKAADFINQIKK